MFGVQMLKILQKIITLRTSNFTRAISQKGKSTFLLLYRNHGILQRQSPLNVVIGFYTESSQL